MSGASKCSSEDAQQPLRGAARTSAPSAAPANGSSPRRPEPVIEDGFAARAATMSAVGVSEPSSTASRSPPTARRAAARTAWVCRARRRAAAAAARAGCAPRTGLRIAFGQQETPRLRAGRSAAIPGQPHRARHFRPRHVERDRRARVAAISNPGRPRPRLDTVDQVSTPCITSSTITVGCSSSCGVSTPISAPDARRVAGRSCAKHAERCGLVRAVARPVATFTRSSRAQRGSTPGWRQGRSSGCCARASAACPRRARMRRHQPQARVAPRALLAGRRYHAAAVARPAARASAPADRRIGSSRRSARKLGAFEQSRDRRRRSRAPALRRRTGFRGSEVSSSGSEARAVGGARRRSNTCASTSCCAEPSSNAVPHSIGDASRQRGDRLAQQRARHEARCELERRPRRSAPAGPLARSSESRGRRRAAACAPRAPESAARNAPGPVPSVIFNQSTSASRCSSSGTSAEPAFARPAARPRRRCLH